MCSLIRFGLALGLCIVGVAAQATRNVPSQYPTIQAAIDASLNGDVVLVQPGTYVENIAFNGKAIRVRSAQGSDVTTIDGNQAGAVVKFVNGETADAVLDGFTITNGRGVWPHYAGGIHCTAGPTVLRCRIVGNFGGVVPSTQNSLITLPGGPGGVYVLGDATFSDCSIEQNVGGPGVLYVLGWALTAGSGGTGGVYAKTTSIYSKSPRFYRCTIKANVAGPRMVDPMAIDATAGTGGIEIGGNLGTPARIIACTVTDNVGSAGVTPYSAGGIRAQYAEIIASLVARNIGGDAALPGTSSALYRAPGGICSEGNVDISFCTVAANRIGASATPPVYVSASGVLAFLYSATIKNSIVHGNIDPTGTSGETGGSPYLGIQYSAVGAGVAGIGNTAADPLFADAANGDFTLASGSPCIDTGIETTFAFEMPAHDLDRKPRWILNGVDMGAFEFGPHDDSLAGTGDDFELASRAVFAGSPYTSEKSVAVFSNFGLVVYSPGGTKSDRYPVIVADLFPTGLTPTMNPYFPEIHWGPTRAVVLDGTLTGATAASLPNLYAIIPPLLAGFTVRLQAIAYDPNAENGFFVATDAHDVNFY